MESKDAISPTVYQKKISIEKNEIKVNVTILGSSYSADKNECNFKAFMAFKSYEDPPKTTSQDHNGFEEDDVIKIRS